MVKVLGFTLYAADWAGSSAPYSQTVSVGYTMTPDQPGILDIDNSATAEQIEAAGNAKLRLSS